MYLLIQVHPVHRLDVSRALRRFLHKLRNQLTSTEYDETAQWVEWSKRLSPSAFVMWLAVYVADSLVDQRGRGVTMQQLLAGVETGQSSLLQDKAEHFLQRTYLTYSPFSIQQGRMVCLLRRLVRRQINRRMELQNC